MKYSVIFLLVIGLLVVVLATLFPGRLTAVGDQQQLAQLALLGALVSSGVIFRYRNKMGEAMRHGAIWAAIALVLVLGYGLKDTLFATLLPGRAAITESGDLILQRAANDHFYADMEINGARVRLMIDTGASGIMLDEASAARAGINIGSLRYTSPFDTANGRTFSAPVSLNEVAFAGKSFANVPAHVASPGALSGPLLGMDFLSRFSRFAIEGDRLILTP